MQLADVDLMEDTWAEGPPDETLALLRREAPVFWHELDGDKAPGFWAITKHDDVRTISRDPATFSSEAMGTFISDPTPEGLAAIRLTLLNMDPPRHSRYRRLVSSGFTPRMIAKLMDQIDRTATAIVDGICERGELDFVEDIAMEMPAQMICEMIGVPQPDRSQIVEWTNTMVGFDDPYWQNTPESGEVAAASIYAYCDALADERRADPQDDILSALVHAEVDGEQLSREELDMFFVILAVAGNETTRNLITHSLVALSDHPDARRQLLDDPTLWPSATEEFLRWGTSIQNFRRTATVDTELRGQQIKAGDKVIMWYVSGNRDERFMDNPDAFIIDRPDVRRHLSFGFGIHRCMGNKLAELQLRILWEEIMQRFERVEVVGDPVRTASSFVHGFTAMPVQLHPLRD
jgi:cholest-4-en-3-one 26-monooxygenase